MRSPLVSLEAAFNLLPRGTIVLLPFDDYLEIESLALENARKYKRLPWSGKSGLLLFRGVEVGISEDFK